MVLSEENRKKLAEYNFKLVIENKEVKALGTVIEMDGAKNLNKVFLDDLLVDICNGLRHGEKQFEDYKKRGIIVEDGDGQWKLDNNEAKKLENDNVKVKD